MRLRTVKSRRHFHPGPGLGAAMALAALAILGGCAPMSKPVLLEGEARAEAAADTSRDRRWEKYGAYCLVDEVFLETSFESGFLNSPVNKYILSRKVRILTAEGAKFGTLEFPVRTQSPTVFKLSHVDSAGREVKIDPGPIRREYLKSGKVIFPKVGPGSMLHVRIEFSSTRPVYTLEHWFSGPIPVAEGRFTFSHLDLYDYDFKAYGPARKGSTERQKGSRRLAYHAWEVKDALPRTDVDYQEDVDATEPRVAVVLRRFRHQDIFESWEELSGQYETHMLKTSFFHSTRRLKALADSLAAGKGGDLEKARAAFDWVRDNVSFKAGELKPINPDKVVSSGQGNLWDMAVVMREMFSHLGLQTDVLITRPRSHGGFDPAFVSPGQLAVPLITVRVGKKDLLAFPFVRGAALGEYPADYMGLQSLSLIGRNAASLPDFASERSYSRAEARLSAGDGSEPIRAVVEMAGYPAFTIRNALAEKSKQEVTEAWQRILTRLGTSNNLRDCEVKGLDRPGAPVKTVLAFTNADQAVRRKGETRLSLSHLFTSHFTGYDTTRSSGFKTSLDMEYEEIVRVAKAPGRALEPSIQCADLSNVLFRVTCAVEDGPEEFVIRRKVDILKGRHTAEAMRALHGDIRELNRIRESSLLWKASEGAASTVKARKK